MCSSIPSGPIMVRGFSLLDPSIASISRNGTQSQWSPCRYVYKTASMVLGLMFCCLSSRSAVKPKSNLYYLSVTKIQGCSLPPVPNASPDPANITSIFSLSVSFYFLFFLHLLVGLSNKLSM